MELVLDRDTLPPLLKYLGVNCTFTRGGEEETVIRTDVQIEVDREDKGQYNDIRRFDHEYIESTSSSLVVLRSRVTGRDPLTVTNVISGSWWYRDLSDEDLDNPCIQQTGHEDGFSSCIYITEKQFLLAVVILVIDNGICSSSECHCEHDGNGNPQPVRYECLLYHETNSNRQVILRHGHVFLYKCN